MSSKTSKIDGIILQSKSFFENDKLVELFSPQVGKIKALAKYAQKKPHIFGGRLEPLNHVELITYQTNSFMLITQCNIVHTYPKIRDSFNRLNLAFYCCNIIRKATVFDQHNHELFDLLSQTLKNLNLHTDTECKAIKTHFEEVFLEIEGITNPNQLTPHSKKSQVEEYIGEKLPLLHL
jgi:DNA repair protein RecO (recombination protein O)